MRVGSVDLLLTYQHSLMTGSVGLFDALVTNTHTHTQQWCAVKMVWDQWVS